MRAERPISIDFSLHRLNMFAMKALALFGVLILAASLSARASARHTQTIISVSLCDLSHHPARYAGRMISVRGTVHLLLESASISDGACRLPIEFAISTSPGVKAPFVFKDDDESAAYKKYERLIAPGYEGGDGEDYSITVTYTGRFDYAGKTGTGYGFENLCRNRIVLRSISGVLVMTASGKRIR